MYSFLKPSSGMVSFRAGGGQPGPAEKHFLVNWKSTFSICILLFSLMGGFVMQTRAEESSGKFALDHRYAVHKQRFTIGRPEGQRKTLIDLWETGLLMRWTEDSLAEKGDKAFSYMQMPAIQFLHIIPALPAGWTRKYSRLENLPVLLMQYDGKERQLEIRALSGEDADLIKLTLTSKTENKVAVTIDTKGGISANKQIYDEKGGSTRFEDGTLWRNDARIHLLAIGGNVVPVDAATLRIEMTADRISETVWLIAPHRAGENDLPAMPNGRSPRRSIPITRSMV